MRVLRTLVTGWLPGLLQAAAAPLRPERGRHTSRAAVRVDGGAVKRSRLKHMADAFLRACAKAQTSVACMAATMLAAALLLFVAPASAQSLARGKPATQSSTYPAAPASKAVDGNTSGSWPDGSVAITNSELNAWWQVDLGAVVSIGRITVHNRTDCCSSRLNNADILVSSSPFPNRALNSAEVAAAKVATIGTAFTINTFDLTAVAGRYLRVQLQGTEYLQLAEVEVFEAIGRVEYLVVGGGGGGGRTGGGGGAGGYKTGTLSVVAGAMTVTVGAGGAGSTVRTSRGVNGGDSVLSSVTSTGGGGGAGFDAAVAVVSGASGGSGGGGGGFGVGGSGGAASPSGQGNAGGNGASSGFGGGGGAGAAGSAGTVSGNGGRGGNGTASSISGSSVTYAGGGGGAAGAPSVAGTGGTGGGGAGSINNANATNGTANTGGGGGGSRDANGSGGNGGNGGSGIVILRYRTDGSDGIHAGSTTGGTKTTSGIYTVHTFTASGTFSVSTAGVEYLVVAGGGGGGGGFASGNVTGGGGGGAGGYRSSVAGETSGGGSVAASALALGVGAHPIVVGVGGTGGSITNNGTNGSDSSIQSPSLVDLVRSAGGGGGAGALPNNQRDGRAGGSGGGAAVNGVGSLAGSGTASQGYNGGGVGTNRGSGGGGGAGGLGVGSANAGNDGYYNYAKAHGGTGGPGVFSSITGSSTQRGGGGGGGVDETNNYLPGIGGLGGGGTGGAATPGTGTAGTANTGGGGGGGTRSAGGNGGSGVVIIRYKTDGSDGIYAPTTTGGTKTTSGIYTVHTFTTSGTFTVSSSPPATLIAKYDFDEGSYNGTTNELKDTAGYTGGPYNGQARGSPVPTQATANPARSGSVGTCGYATLPGPAGNGGGFITNALPVVTTAGAKTTVAFWMRWDGTDSVMPIGWGSHDLWFSNGHFGFNTSGGDIYGISNTGLANTWRHVVAVFTNGSVTNNRIYIDGVLQTLTQRQGTPSSGNAVVSTQMRISGWGASTGYRMKGDIDQVRVYNGEANASEVAALYAETSNCTISGPHRLEIQRATGTGLTCTPSTVTVKACADAACATAYTSGVSGTLQATGGSVNWPATAAFTIPAGSSTTTVSLQSTTTTPTVLGVASSTPAASNAATCNFGSPACTFTSADAGFLFDVPDHVAEVAQTVTVSAVRKQVGSLACTPAFASTSKAVTFRCSYTNPTTGTLPVRVGSTALSASAAAACDAGGRAVSLAFDASGVATTTVQYADVGNMLLSASYSGSAGTSEAGLVMIGSDSFIAAPDSFTVAGVTAGPLRASSAFAATVSARNSAGANTPNYGRETSPEGATLSWVRIQPSGSAAVDGSFSGSLGSFAGGSASASNLVWTEVGRGDLLARSANAGGYLGTGLHAFGASPASGARQCATEGGNCVLPGATTATIYYGESSSYTARTGQTGTVACNSSVFGNPLVGTTKQCWYAATIATNGSVGDFIPHRFTVAASNACGSFSYAGQPITTTVTARNAAGNTTANFNGTATTTPSFAQAVTLADANGLGMGSLSGATIAASAFSAGVASATPSYSFTSKTTAPQSLVLRATNGAAGAALISSAGYAEPTLPLRSGRLRLANAFGQASAALQVPVVVEHWGGSAWQLNSADSCTALAASSIALSNPRSATGAASTATSNAGAVAISSGSGTLTLAAPSPAGSSLSLDLAVNLGSAGTDQSCNASKPASTGAALPWLRAQNGSCAATADRDPAARASFGIFAPETRKTVHVRDLF